MNTCCSCSKIIQPLSLLVCLLVPWSGVPRHWIMGMEWKGEFMCYNKQNGYCESKLRLKQVIYIHPLLLSSICLHKILAVALLNQKGMPCFPEGRPLNNGQNSLYSLSTRGVKGVQSSGFSSLFTLIWSSFTDHSFAYSVVFQIWVFKLPFWPTSKNLKREFPANSHRKRKLYRAA